MKFSWSKLLGLNDDVLSKESQEVEVVYEEPKTKKTKTKSKAKKKKKTTKLKESDKDFVSASEKGQIDIDLYEDTKNNNLVIKAKIPGVKADDVDVVVEPDLLIIRGERSYESRKDSHHYYYRECAWGEFLRRLVLPCRVKPEKVDASLKQGVLTIVLPKVKEESSHVEVK